MEHHGPMCEIELDADLWRWIPTPVRTAAEMREYIRAALELQSKVEALPFVLREEKPGRLAGCTRYANIDRANYGIEISWT